MYESEHKNIAQARQIIEQHQLSDEALWEAFKTLAKQYETLLGDIKFLAKISDRLQNKLVGAHEALKTKTKGLEQAHRLNIEQYDELKAIKLTLEEKVEERTRELKDANSELTAINTELDNFVYRAAHDIRGPIARLIGLCNVALIEAGEDVSLKYFNMISQNAYHMNDILGRLLHTNTLKNLQVNFTDVVLQTAFEKATSAVSNLDNFPAIDLQIKIPPKLTFCSDFNILTILLESLLEHAIKNNVINGRKKSFIQFQMVSEDESFQMYLVYSGVEISAEQAPYIFDMFHRISNQEGVLGMELYTAKLAAKRLSGQLEFIASNSKETIFSIFLPLVSPS